MTKSVELVNTSNWENENVRVTGGNADTILKPGERVRLSHQQDMDIRVEWQVDDERPFRMNGSQMVPVVNVGFERI